MITDIDNDTDIIDIDIDAMQGGERKKILRDGSLGRVKASSAPNLEDHDISTHLSIYLPIYLDHLESKTCRRELSCRI